MATLRFRDMVVACSTKGVVCCDCGDRSSQLILAMMDALELSCGPFGVEADIRTFQERKIPSSHFCQVENVKREIIYTHIKVATCAPRGLAVCRRA